MNEACDDRKSTLSSKSCYEEKECKRPRKELLKQHHIGIQFLDSGCTIQVGCKAIAFHSAELAMDSLTAYVKDPAKETEKWNKVFNEE